jgi:hypothetical protein
MEVKSVFCEQRTECLNTLLVQMNLKRERAGNAVRIRVSEFWTAVLNFIPLPENPVPANSEQGSVLSRVLSWRPYSTLHCRLLMQLSSAANVKLWVDCSKGQRSASARCRICFLIASALTSV